MVSLVVESVVMGRDGGGRRAESIENARECGLEGNIEFLATTKMS